MFCEWSTSSGEHWLWNVLNTERDNRAGKRDADQVFRNRQNHVVLGFVVETKSKALAAVES